jgi:uncharacterized protein YndB with AHSA1/START domain
MAANDNKISTAKTSAGWELTITRVFDAPRALVFEMWTKPEHLARWWGPTGFTLHVCEVDFRVGGGWHLVFRGPDGTDYPFDSIYKEIVVPERIVFAGTLAHVPGDQVRTTLTFTEHEGKTTLTVHQVHSVESDATKGAPIGWTQTLDKLEAVLAKR